MVFVIVQPDRELAACIRQLKNISTFRHSSRSLRLKLSMKPFWTGHPGAHGRESDRADLAIERLQIRQRCAIHGSQYSISSGKYKRGKAASIHRNHDDHQTATSGVRVRSPLRQSIPSRSIDSCARLRHTNSTLGLRPDESAASRRLRTDRVHPSPSHHSSLTISPRHPRNTNRFGTTAVHATRSEPAHSVHRIRDADPSLLSNPDLGPTGSWITDEDSLAEYATVSDRLALHSDHRSPRKFDIIAPPAEVATASTLASPPLARHRNRDQRCARLVQFAMLVRTTPLEQLVRVHTLRSRHFGHARPSP